MHELWTQLHTLELESDSNSGNTKCFLPVPSAAAEYLLDDLPSKLFIRDSYIKLANIVLSGGSISWSDPPILLHIISKCLFSSASGLLTCRKMWKLQIGQHPAHLARLK